jgi:acyl-ACP thioesterase
MPIVGINTGHLGFFQELYPEDLDQFIFNYKKGRYSVQNLVTVQAVVTDQDGNECVKATSSLLVLNLDTRRLVRDPNLMDEGTTCSDNAMESPAAKVQMPKDVEPELVMDHTVSYSDVDLLGHTNNAMYMHWAMDAVDYELASTRPVKELTINFNHETKAGENVKIYRATVEREDGLHVFVEGKVDGASSFCVEIIF